MDVLDSVGITAKNVDLGGRNIRISLPKVRRIGRHGDVARVDPIHDQIDIGQLFDRGIDVGVDARQNAVLERSSSDLVQALNLVQEVIAGWTARRSPSRAKDQSVGAVGGQESGKPNVMFDKLVVQRGVVHVATAVQGDQIEVVGGQQVLELAHAVEAVVANHEVKGLEAAESESLKVLHGLLEAISAPGDAVARHSN